VLFFADRHRRAGRYLEWKVWIFTVAAGFTLAGLYFEDRRLTGAAIGLLLCAVLLRFLPGGVGDRAEQDDEEEETDPDRSGPEGTRSS